jgi:hypothetical protein
MSTLFVTVRIEHDIETGDFSAKVERRHEGEEPSDAQEELAARVERAAREAASAYMSGRLLYLVPRGPFIVH